MAQANPDALQPDWEYVPKSRDPNPMYALNTVYTDLDSTRGWDSPPGEPADNDDCVFTQPCAGGETHQDSYENSYRPDSYDNSGSVQPRVDDDNANHDGSPENQQYHATCEEAGGAMPDNNSGDHCLQSCAVTVQNETAFWSANSDTNPCIQPYAVRYQEHNDLSNDRPLPRIDVAAENRQTANIASDDVDIRPYAVAYMKQDDIESNTTSRDIHTQARQSLQMPTAASNNINDVLANSSSNDANPSNLESEQRQHVPNALHSNPMYVPNVQHPTAGENPDRMMQKITFGGKGNEPGKFRLNYGVAVSDDNEIFVADNVNNRVQVFSINGSFLRLFPTVVPGEDTKIFPVSVGIGVEPGYLWVIGVLYGAELNARVVKYRRDGLIIEKFDVHLMGRYPCPIIAIDVRNNKVIVGEADTIRMFQPNGSLVRSFKAFSKERGVRINGVISDNEGNIFLTNYKSVQVYSHLGVKIFEFGNFGRDEGQLRSLKGISIGPLGHIIVANSGNNRVDMFTSQGKFVRTVANITDPWGLAVGPDGQLAVSNPHDALFRTLNRVEHFNMAESKLLNRLSEDFLECQICLQPYRRPKSLKDTVDVHKKLTNEGESLVCGSCETKSGAESFCTECGDFLCDECVAIHRRIKVTKGHQVIGVEQLKAESDTVKIKPRPLPPCRIHSQETLKFFCIDCSEAICQVCTALSHKDHKYEYFTDTARKAKEDILALLAKTEKKMVDLKNADQLAHAQKTELEKNVTETVEKIKRKAEQTRKELVALVNQQEAELLDCVNTVSQTRSKEFSTAIEEIETATVALESAAEFGRNIVEHGSEFEIMEVRGDVNSRLKRLLQVELAEFAGELPAKAYMAFEEDKTSHKVKPCLGEVKTTQDSGFRTVRFTTLGTTGRLGPTSLGTHYRGQDHEGLVQLKDGIQYFTVPDTGQYRIEAADSGFRTARFTTLGITGRLGPTSLGTHYRGQDHVGLVQLKDGIQYFTVPDTGMYRVEAAGWGKRDPKSARGRGAVVKGIFQLQKGEVLKILVGQEGGENKFSGGVGGGGGTFVTKTDNTPLIVAGGAGGGNNLSNKTLNSDGTTGTAGQYSSGGATNFAGGSDGKGAKQGNDDYAGGGGGGLLTDGASGKVLFGGTDGDNGGEGGKAFVNGGVGGRGVTNNAEGGFGGGGGSYGHGAFCWTFNSLELFNMAESKLLNRLSEDFLECQICLQPYRRPKSLKDTVDVHKKLTNEGESLVCGSCETKSGAESFCTECGDLLCDECVAIHRRIKVTRGHQVIGVEQLKAESESNTVKINPRPLPPCRIHSQETLKLFCVDCSEAICQVCTVLSHKDHKYEYFTDTAAKAKEDIRALLAKKEKKMLDLKNADQQANAQKTDLEKNVSETSQKIKRKAEKTRKELVALVNQQETELLSYVNTVSQTRSKEFSTAIEEIETTTVALESAAEFGRNIVEHGSEFDIMAVSGDVNSRLKKLLQIELADITEKLPANAYIAFEEDETSDMGKPRLGEVRTMQPDSGFRTARFSTLGSTGRLGPTSLGTHYRGQDHEGLVQLKDGIQYFTVPDTGKYRVEAAGSAAGWGEEDPKSARGRGALVRGTFHLHKGEVLKILVGQEGTENMLSQAVGGGGGTFVTKTDNTPLIVAGGAGGGDDMNERNPNSDGTTATAGQYSSCGATNFAGGSDGKGATQGDNDNVGGGGGGPLTDGASGEIHFGGTDGDEGGEGGKAFVNGGVGGRGVYNNADGGFGGGGGSHGQGGGGGGGGGYSGGGRGITIMEPVGVEVVPITQDQTLAVKEGPMTGRDFLECQICLQPYRRPKRGYCQICTVLSHKDHKYEYFADTAVKAKEDILDLLAKTEIKMLDLKNAEKQAHTQKTELEKNVTETIEKIRRKAEKTRRQLLTLVNQQEAALLNSVNTVGQTRSKEFSTAIEEIETATVALESAAEFGRNIVEHGSEFDIMADSGDVNSRLKKLLQIELADITEKLPAKAYITFEEDETSDMGKPRLGEVRTMQPDSGFRTARFTTLGTTGRLGPTSLGTHYRGQDHEGLVQLKDGIQYFTVPYTGQYRVEAAGSAAGWGVNDPKSARGRGAVVRGTFQLQKGEVLKVLVGQEGGKNKYKSAVGGGGGTFVTKTDSTPLIVAGGAGGGNGGPRRNSNSDGTTEISGQCSSGGDTNFAGGSDGKGATQGHADFVGGGDFNMAESKLLNRLSEDFLECQICLQPYRRPKSLKDTVDVHKKLTNEGESLVCGSCETKSGAESFCTDCGFFLCDECVAIHRRIAVTRGHQVIGVEQLKAERDTVKIKPRPLPPCRIHSQETLKLFCIDCSEAICQVCTVLSHKDHKYEYFTDTAVKAKEDILDLLTKVEKTFGDLKTADQQAHAQKTELEKNVTETIEKIKRKAEKTRRQLVTHVNQQEAELLSYVSTVSQTRSKEFSTAIEEIETATVALESAAEFGRNIVKYGSDFEIMAINGEVNDRLKTLLQTELVNSTEKLTEKAYVAFEEEEMCDMVKPRLGEVHAGTFEGAAAGWGVEDDKSARGRGAVIRGTFRLQRGEVLKILVGQEGGENKHSGGVGGGGGTFVTKTDNTPLIVAGGAGGGQNMRKKNSNSDGTTMTTGQRSAGGCPNFGGGTDGKGATEGCADHVGGGGGGLLTDGASGKVHFGGTDGNYGGEGGKAFVNGGVGGRGVLNNAEGGFGGGGGSYGRGGGEGGGGGYSGGGRGGKPRGACGGGGGSYNSGSDTSGEGGTNDGAGYVKLTRILYLPWQSNRNRKRSHMPGNQSTSTSKRALVAGSPKVPSSNLRLASNKSLPARTVTRLQSPDSTEDGIQYSPSNEEEIPTSIPSSRSTGHLVPLMRHTYVANTRSKSRLSSNSASSLNIPFSKVKGPPVKIFCQLVVNNLGSVKAETMVWLPDIFFVNEKAAGFISTTGNNKMLRIYPNGEVLYSEKYTMLLKCRMNFEMFPMDTQVCTLQTESYSHTDKDLLLIWDENPVVLSGDIELPEYILRGKRYTTCDNDRDIGTFTCLEAQFKLVRRLGFYLLSSYIPSIMITVLSWLTFWISPEIAPARVALGITTVLTSTALFGVNRQTMPRFSYIRAMDIWMMVCISFVFGALVEFIAVHFIFKRHKKFGFPKKVRNLVGLNKHWKFKYRKQVRNFVANMCY
uniref:receptor protein-tyrosine kinase n=1 Tax=Branchiostoma floridae TaxID=7739 RepID=C3XXT4_BRAFL|eukprot:XP_002611534.1 hypothetical protein BRAFLDRAFT_117187 [Branchiostoma floridae]